LQQLAQKINNQRNQLTNLPTTGKRYWNQLQELFRLISGIDPQLNADLGVPRYNGGLFDPAQHPFLEQHFVGDRALALAIDYLATRRIIEKGKPPAYQTVDYRTLDVRQLGSIYEGLLEYKVAVAAEEMVTISQKGVETWVPLAQKGKAKTYGDRRQPGELYLTTDKGERKATGSYYTPDYIVEYIVANTLGPLVEGARERVRAQVRDTGSLDKAARQKQNADRFIAEILHLNVLDPAMGSGHFLVEATHFLARALATDEYVQAAPQVTGTWGTPSSSNNLAQVPVTATAETDLLYWKRRVVEACIYGVDKNPMAVELAKLSLWLKTAASDKPLSFLDHHLQHGDSLIGAWLADLQRAPGPISQSPISSLQSSLFDDSAFTRDAGLAVKGVATIESLPTLDIDDVHAKEAAWRDIQQTHVARWRRLADLWVSAYFGNAMSAEEYRALAGRLQGQASLLSDEVATAFLAHPAVTGSDYFHWELAFPEVFFDEYGNSLGRAAGFDAVIGNPPYVRQEQMAAIKPFLPHAYESVYKGTADLYVYFLQGGVSWLRNSGFLSFIVSNKWLRADYGEGLRDFLSTEAKILGIVDFGHAPVFEDADTFPCILVLEKKSEFDDDQNGQTSICIFPRKELEGAHITEFISENAYDVSSRRFSSKPWSLEQDQVQSLIEKIESSGKTLYEYSGLMPLSGLKTGLNSVYLIDQQTRDELVSRDAASRNVIKPYLRGRDLKRWLPDYQELWIILLKSSANYDWPWAKAESEVIAEQIFSTTYPALFDYMKQDEDRLRKRSDSGVFWWELRSCVYYDAFEKPSIMWQDLAFHSRFSLAPSGYFPEMTCFALPDSDLWLLACLNSPLLWTWLWRNTIHGKDEVLRLKTTYTQNIPIASPTESQRNEAHSLVESIIQLSKENRELIDDFIYWLLLGCVYFFI
jgi:hypothetical protein